MPGPGLGTGTGGYIYRQGTSAQTFSVISTRFKIFSPAVEVGKFVKLGVTSAFNVQETKNVEAIRGLGYGDQIAELVPGVTQPTSLTIDRTCLYLANLMQVLGYKAGVSGAVRSLKHHKWPFDLKCEIVFSEIVSESGNLGQATVADVAPEGGLNNYGNPGLYAVVTLYEGCWLNQYSTGFQVETAAVAENCGIDVTDIFDVSGSVYGDFLDSGNAPSDVTGGSLIFGQG
jgi:hypothetical protein